MILTYIMLYLIQPQFLKKDFKIEAFTVWGS